MGRITDSVYLGTEPAKAKALCVFVHGRTQSPEIMRETVIDHLVTSDVAYCLPRAEGASWYDAKAVDPLTDDTRHQLAQSVEALLNCVTGFQDQAPNTPLVLAGFSQGACLSLELAFTGDVVPKALVAFTGCRVGTSGDKRASALPAQLPIYLSAGNIDPWIPLDAYAQAVVELGAAGAQLRSDVFPDRDHEVSKAEIAVLDTVLAAVTSGEPAFSKGSGR